MLSYQSMCGKKKVFSDINDLKHFTSHALYKKLLETDPSKQGSKRRKRRWGTNKQETQRWAQAKGLLTHTQGKVWQRGPAIQTEGVFVTDPHDEEISKSPAPIDISRGDSDQIAENLGLTSDRRKEYKEAKNKTIINSVYGEQKGMCERKSTQHLVRGSALTFTHSHRKGNTASDLRKMMT